MASIQYSTGKRRSRRSRNHFEILPEEIIEDILSRLSFSKLFQVESVCRSWREIVRSSAHFQILLTHRPLQYCHFMFKNWCLRAACDSIFIYAHKKNGKLRVLDTLDLQSVELPDEMIGHRHLSFYLKKDLAVVRVWHDSEGYEVEISVIDGITTLYSTLKLSCKYCGNKKS
ncbi:hypothetical protein SUGI_0351360 [Cryptomeria japonica]|nr:hypothetical protein SUGI_0351360 [Cryptomeria japonica]